ncbi:FAD-dependent oxidoreductase [Schaalia odontolytica]|uniref:Pyridine nucleotide-disulfide oxidoreductase n=2 Tax=Schaalia odontolytica TaxID=1660 RepID=A0A857A5V4_9ACTO|nr:FAD-dependent oxidoreductase [Schaalia odontolytica]QGS10672.1 pyridine nucleotide-disulfide oxidoreductase [Schaalia odontolytica]
MRVVVVGGVAGGMSAAARLRRRDEGAEIIVLERGSYVSFANCGLPYYVGGEIEDSAKLLLHTPQSLKAALNLDVRINSEVTAIDLDAHSVTVANSDTGEAYTLSYDYLILSPGALAARPPIDGLDSPRVHTLRTVDDALALREASGTRAIVLGAGFIGIEAAEALAARGFETHLVELAEHVLPPLEVEMATLVTQELRGLGVHVHAGVAAQTIAHADNNDVVTLSDGTVLHADVIVLSAGVRPDTAVVEAAGIQTRRGYVVIDDHGRTSADDIYAIGDGTIGRDHDRPVALAGPANRGGRLIADAITDAERGEATARPIPSPQGTAIVRIGSLTAAMTGANRQALDASGTEYFTVHTHANQHAGYFPGAQPVHILMHVGAGGEILGAQAVGTDGVDRRIDVIATAMRAGLKAADLIDLDLAYAPPYGQAKDPVNQTGMVAHNVATGELILTGPDTLTEDMPVLDVRTPGEYAAGHMPNSLNIPHTQLRDRLDEVRAWVDENAHEQPFVVMCAAGVRSWIGYRIVRAAGFDVTMLSGGIQTLRAWLGDRAATVLVKE